jgi:hypothetical protein
MRILGWILTVVGYIWGFSGVMRILAAVSNAIPGNHVAHVAMGVGTLLLAALAIWGGQKLRNRALTRALP